MPDPVNPQPSAVSAAPLLALARKSRMSEAADDLEKASLDKVYANDALAALKAVAQTFGLLLVLDWIKLALYSRMRQGAGRPHWYTRFLQRRHAAHAVAQPGNVAA